MNNSSGNDHAGVEVQVRWQSRREPLRPLGLAAHGNVARQLAQRLMKLSDETLVQLRGVAAPGLLVIIGEEKALPWVDGVIYLGRDERAPSLLLPTTLEPVIPLPLVERALLGQSNERPPLAVLPDELLIVPVGSARAVARETLISWVEAA
ncbi:MAG TPA: hypothetical protein VFD58_14085 [Blastocatellia bacterium]|nr:hypothetical protein [Blastocatellia bacterium]